MTDDIYAAPESDLSSPRLEGEYGSLERAVEGDYEFAIADVISEAWAKISGIKFTMQLAFGIYFLLLIIVTVGLGFFLPMVGLGVEPGVEPDGSTIMLTALLQNVVVTGLTVPVGAGIFMLGVRRSMEAPLSAMSVVGYYNKVVPLLLTTILMYIMILIGLLLLILPGIYLMIAYYMAVPLVVEKNMGPWQALETSRKAVGKRWFSVLGLLLLLSLINLIGLIPLGIGLVWTLPVSVIAFGLLYRNMFGVEQESLAG